MAMSQARFNSIMSGMTSVARKVYEAVPKQETWPTAQIVSELQRSGVNVQYHIAGGCLNALQAAGLINEPVKGEYRREVVREIVRSVKPTIEEEPTMAKAHNLPTPKTTPPMPAVAAPATNPLDIIGRLAQRTAILAQNVTVLAQELRSLADDISDAAVEVQGQIDVNAENVEKVRQLSSLLSSFKIA